MKTQAEEALNLLKKEDELNTVVFVQASKNEEKVEFFSWVELLERNKEAYNFNKIYQEFNDFVNSLSLYSLDSFIHSYNYQKDLLLVIAGRAYEAERMSGIEFKIFFEVGSLLEQAREQVIRLIEDKEKLLKPYLSSQIKFLRSKKNLSDEQIIEFVMPHIKSLINFDKLTPKELSKFSLGKADPKVIRTQLATLIDNFL